MITVEEFACAKINLTLEIVGRRSDGYHALRSLVAFALDVGDRLTLTPGPTLSLETSGPEATAIDGTNLIITVAKAIQSQSAAIGSGTFRLEKHLPVASGIGGGSADAAAAIRTLARANAIDDPAAVFGDLAASIGADIPVCIGGDGREAAFMSGIGEKVWRPASGTLLPREGLPVVLINPRVPVATAAVFKALAAPPLSSEAATAPPAPFASAAECLAYVAASRNDLEAPAVAIAPVIADVLEILTALPGCRLARMSGSGATCFALFDGMADARDAAAALRRNHASWWIEATRLG